MLNGMLFGKTFEVFLVHRERRSLGVRHSVHELCGAGRFLRLWQKYDKSVKRATAFLQALAVRNNWKVLNIFPEVFSVL